ncbi:MAG TPA: acyl-CoA-binding protein [Steroidobacteraceae bacterium]|nr:acyl-CoA-binding protein [Steroidobacteraceae bacterium]
MAEIDKKFEAAAKDIQTLTKRPDDEDMLRLYALYKQGTEGDVQGERPSAFSIKDRAKYDAWARVKGTESTKAREQYVKLVERLKKTYG